MGGDDKYLLQVYRQSEDKSGKLAALNGFRKLISICADSALGVSKIAQSDDRELRHRAICILAEFDYASARLPLEALLKGPSEDQLTACKAIHCYAKQYAGEWVDVVGPIAAKTSDIELFRFASYVLESSGMDCTRYLLPAASHPDEDIRQQAIHTIGRSLENPESVEAILTALGDESPKVVHAALQAHEKPLDHRFLEAYASIADRFEVDEHCVLANLSHRLRAIGYDSTAAFVFDFKADRVGKRGFWTRFFR
ncbi:MAG: HEAT repeat domain-containing protein [Sphingomonas sp.]